MAGHTRKWKTSPILPPKSARSPVDGVCFVYYVLPKQCLRRRNFTAPKSEKKEGPSNANSPCEVRKHFSGKRAFATKHIQFLPFCFVTPDRWTGRLSGRFICLKSAEVAHAMFGQRFPDGCATARKLCGKPMFWSFWVLPLKGRSKNPRGHNRHNGQTHAKFNVFC